MYLLLTPVPPHVHSIIVLTVPEKHALPVQYCFWSECPAMLEMKCERRCLHPWISHNKLKLFYSMAQALLWAAIEVGDILITHTINQKKKKSKFPKILYEGEIFSADCLLRVIVNKPQKMIRNYCFWDSMRLPSLRLIGLNGAHSLAYIYTFTSYLRRLIWMALISWDWHLSS